MYPLLPWLSVMILGWTFGRWLLSHAKQPDLAHRAARLLMIAGSIAILIFFVQRIVNSYGNCWLPRTDDDPLRWLQVSKYPPSLAFYCLELGLMAVFLAGFFGLQSCRFRNLNGPLTVFGQTALFFFLIHIHLMMLVRFFVFGLDGSPPFEIVGTWIGVCVALVVLYPICAGTAL